MNTTIPQPFSYPMSSPMPWLPVPFQSPVSYSVPQSVSPFVLPQQANLLPRKIPSSASFSNTRYHQLKQSAGNSNRRTMHRSIDASIRPRRNSFRHHSTHSHHHQPQETRSMHNLEQILPSSSARLLKAHSWHTMAKSHPSNLSVAYAHEMHLTPKRRRRRSLRRKTKLPPPPPPPSARLSFSSQRIPSFRQRRKRPPIHLPERGVVRISTLDELPMASHRVDQRRQSINQDRISTKGSVSNFSQHRTKSKEKLRRTNSIDNRSQLNDDQHLDSIRVNSDGHSSCSSSCASSSSDYHSLSLQRRLNGSLRNDPLITAAMEDYRQLRQESSQTSLNSHHQSLRRDSLRSNSTFRSSTSTSSSARHSQSSFTSVERCEIRQLMQTFKRKDSNSLNNTLQPSPIPGSPTLSEQSINISSTPSEPITRPKKSALTEELDREFSKLRARDSDQDINSVMPSLICKRKRIPEISSQPIPSLPKLDELLRQVQLRPIDKTIKSLPLKEKPIESTKEDSFLSIPVPCSSPIPTEETKSEEFKHEYAVPIKQNTNRRFLPQISHFQPSHRLKFNRSISKHLPETRTPRSLSMFNWFHQNLTHSLPTTFQPTRIHNQIKEPVASSVKENIYTSTVEIDSSASAIEQTVDDMNLQLHLENQSIVTDDSYSDYETNHTTKSSSILTDLSHLFTRKHKHENLSSRIDQRCSVM